MYGRISVKLSTTTHYQFHITTDDILLKVMGLKVKVVKGHLILYAD